MLQHTLYEADMYIYQTVISVIIQKQQTNTKWVKGAAKFGKWNHSRNLWMCAHGSLCRLA